MAGNKVIPSKATTAKSCKASLLGFSEDSIIPKWRDVDNRELNIPPKAPPPSKKGGTRTKSPLMMMKWSIFEFINRPDPVLKKADIIKMKKLSLQIFVVIFGFLLNKKKLETTQTRTITEIKKYFHARNLTAANKQGSVIKSPTDVIKGAVTLSGSHPLEKLWTATNNVNTSMNMLEMNPPTTDMTTKSMKEIEMNPKMNAVTRERIARQKETVNVRKREAATFPVITGDLSSFEISPTCSAVLIREPKEAKIFPRIPIAAGTIIINPGSRYNVSEKVPKYTPPKSDPREARTSERIPCLKT